MPPVSTRARALTVSSGSAMTGDPPLVSPSGSPTITRTIKGEAAVGNGWIRRAERLLDGLSISPEHALLAYQRAHVALMGQRDPVAARRLSAEAAALARYVGPADMEMLGVALEGLSIVTGGEVAAGMSLLDEATAAAPAGEMNDPGMIGTACCYLIRACEQVHDYDRAAQWCERVREFCRRWNFTGLFSACRIQYASLLTLRGAWAEAEREIEALHRHVERVQPRLVPIALIRLGDLEPPAGSLGGGRPPLGSSRIALPGGVGLCRAVSGAR